MENLHGVECFISKIGSLGLTYLISVANGPLFLSDLGIDSPKTRQIYQHNIESAYFGYIYCIIKSIATLGVVRYPDANRLPQF